MNSHCDLIAASYTSPRQSIEGFYYFDCIKKAWYKITKSAFIYVSFEYNGGCRWGTLHHLILEKKRAPAKVSRDIEGCFMSTYNEKYKA